jgi:hypothetical protein
VMFLLATMVTNSKILSVVLTQLVSVVRTYEIGQEGKRKCELCVAIYCVD